jgi:hypothetical protein
MPNEYQIERGLKKKELMAMTKQQLIENLLDQQEENEDLKYIINERKIIRKNARVRYEEQDKLLEAYRKENDELKQENKKQRNIIKETMRSMGHCVSDSESEEEEEEEQ